MLQTTKAAGEFFEVNDLNIDNQAILLNQEME